MKLTEYDSVTGYAKRTQICTHARTHTHPHAKFNTSDLRQPTDISAKVKSPSLQFS